ncbi:MAG TPA: carbonic anhydrase [Bacillales bacterium]|nr:carbonic anhydrase [Bacillales bacterium]HEU5139162.1 carbonic anhydrase [Bacillales bacterium]
MSTVSEILDHNQRFVAEKEYEVYETSKFPEKKIVVLTCMDTRLTELLPKAMGLKNGDAKVLKNAGAMVINPFDSAIQGILVGLWQLGAEEVVVVGHHDCGMAGLKGASTLEKMKESGISEDMMSALSDGGVDLEKWLSGFESVPDNVKNSVNMIKQHPLLPEGTKVHGLIIDPGTGKLDLVVEDQ